jgi:hypothetical protein
MSFGEEEWEARKASWLLNEFVEWCSEQDIYLFETDGQGSHTGQDEDALITRFLKERNEAA